MQQKGKAMIESILPGEIVTLNTRHDSNEVVDREQRYKQIIEIMTEHPERPLSATDYQYRSSFS